MLTKQKEKLGDYLGEFLVPVSKNYIVQFKRFFNIATYTEDIFFLYSIHVLNIDRVRLKHDLI